MSAYPEQLLQNTLLHDEASHLYGAGFISKEQRDHIRTTLPALDTQPNLLMRGGLALLGYLMLIATYAFLVTFMLVDAGRTWKFFLLMDSAIAFFALEFVIRRRRYFRFGIDDAFLFAGEMMFLSFIGSLSEFDDFFPIYFAAMVMGCICAYRYLDSFSTLIACVATTAMIADLGVNGGTLGQSLLPFLIMANAGGLFLIYRLLKKHPRVAVLYSGCLKAVYGYSLIILYISGNYFIVREGNVALMGASLAPGTDIPLAWFFYAFTLGVPAVYIFFGLKRRHRLLLHVGVLALAAGVYTIRHYYSVMPPEWALVGVGAVLFALAYVAIVKLRDKETGTTYKPDRFTNTEDLLNTEAAAIAESFAVKPQPTAEPQFGGGESGGGGAGGGY